MPISIAAPLNAALVAAIASIAIVAHDAAPLQSPPTSYAIRSNDDTASPTLPPALETPRRAVAPRHKPHRHRAACKCICAAPRRP